MFPRLAADASGRPRIEGDREAEILQGVIDLLVETGYDKLTFDAVATKVKASKATLYRKWPSKALLVVSAVEMIKGKSHMSEHGIPDTGSLEGDLTSQFCADADYSEEIAKVMGAMMSALQRDPELTTVINERFIKPQVAMLHEVMERAQQRGEIGPDADLDLLASITPAYLTYRAVLDGAPPDTAYMAAVINQVVLPACRASIRPTRGPETS